MTISVFDSQEKGSIDSKSFFKLTPDVRNKLLETNLTAAEWRIWRYPVSLNFFGYHVAVGTV